MSYTSTYRILSGGATKRLESSRSEAVFHGDRCRYNTDFLDLLDPASGAKLSVQEGERFMSMRNATTRTATSAPEVRRPQWGTP